MTDKVLIDFNESLADVCKMKNRFWLLTILAHVLHHISYCYILNLAFHLP